ncbi:hypothetical protein KCU93_g9846, partial [Aureobasidium melanogenum]
MTTQVEDVFEDIPSLGKRVQKMIDKANKSDKDTLLDLCAYVAFLRNDDDCYEALDRNMPPFDYLNKPDTKAALKRLYGDEDQYRRGIDTFDPLIAGMGCGSYIGGVNVVSCVSPLKQKMHLEIMSGMSDGQGSIRLSELTDDIAGGITFMLHSALIDQVVFLPSPDDADAFRVVVVPSASVGASTITRDLPKLMVFDVPRGHKLDGFIARNAGQNETTEDVIEKVFNDPSMLCGHGKHVIKADAEEFISSVKPREEDRAMCHQDWRENIQVLYTKVNNLEAVLYFLPTGIFYGWNDPLSYFSHESIKHIEIHEGTKAKKTFDMTLEVTEPYYHTGKTTKVELKSLSKQDLEPIKSGSSQHKQKQADRWRVGVQMPQSFNSYYIYCLGHRSLTSQQPVVTHNLIFRPAGVAQSVERVALII